MAKEGSVGGFLRPMERIVGKEDTWKAGDIKASESVPRVEDRTSQRPAEPRGRRSLRRAGDILCDVGCVAARGGASSMSRISGSRLSGANMGEVWYALQPMVLVLFFVSSCPLSFVGWFLFAVPRIVICSSS